MKIWQASLALLAFVGLCAFGMSGGGGGGGASRPGADGVFNVKEFGATGDGVILWDATMTAGSSILTSASATFTAADVGKLICVAGASASTVSIPAISVSPTNKEKCGTIQTFTDAHNVVLSFSNASGGALSSMMVDYATDDCSSASSGIRAALTAVGATTGGGKVYFPYGLYGCSQPLTVPGTVNVWIQGVGSSHGIWAYTPVVALFKHVPASAILWLTTSLTDPAITEGHSGDTGIIRDRISDIALIGGAGLAMDGGGSGPGLLVGPGERFVLEDTNIENFGGDCADFDASALGGGFIVAPQIRNNWFSFCGGVNGVLFYGSQQDIQFFGNESDFQNKDGLVLNVSQAGAAGFIENNIIQNNGQVTGGAYNIRLAYPANFTISDTTMEQVNGSANYFFPTPFNAAVHWGSNTCAQNPCLDINFQKTVTQLPACGSNIYRHAQPMCVLDAAALTLGSVYDPTAGAGGARAMVQCDGTNWVIVGACGILASPTPTLTPTPTATPT